MVSWNTTKFRTANGSASATSRITAPARRRHASGNAAPARSGFTVGTAIVSSVIRYTRVTSRVPNRPLGFTVSTATISASAIVSFSSRPT